MSKEVEPSTRHVERWKIDPGLTHTEVVAHLQKNKTTAHGSVTYTYTEETGDLVLYWSKPNERTEPIAHHDYRAIAFKK